MNLNELIFSLDIIPIVAGAVLLIYGRKLFWLFVASVGFVVGFNYGPFLLSSQSPLLIWIIALGAGLLGAVLAVLAKEAAIWISGFLAGIYISYNILQWVRFPSSKLNWILLILVGLVTAWLLLNIFDYVLIFLSSFLGAYILIKTTNFFPQYGLTLLLVLFFAGIVLQMKLFIHSQEIKKNK